MADYRFKRSERFGVWHAFGGVCYWCGDPVSFRDVTIDHVIPESASAADLAKIKVRYGLDPDFDVNDFENWVPAHERCNRKKGKRLFRRSPAMIATLDEVHRQARKSRSAADKFAKGQKRDKLLAEIEQAIENQTITAEDLRDAFGLEALRELFSGLHRLAFLKHGTEALMIVPGYGIQRSDAYVEYQADNEIVRQELPRRDMRMISVPFNVIEADQLKEVDLEEAHLCSVCGRVHKT